MNKALEQKLIGTLEESHTKNNPPKQFCEWSFEQGDRKWQQDELELVLELVGEFFGRKKECVDARMSGGGHQGPARQGRAPRRALDPRGQVPAPLMCSQHQIFSNILAKIISNLQGIWRTFIFGVFFIARIKQKTNRKILCLLYLI